MNNNVTKTGTFDVAKSEKSSPITNGLTGLAVAVVALLVIFWNLADEPFFIDESAMIGQSYYYTLLKAGQWQHADWLHYAAYDHPPLPKYFFGLSLDLAGLPVPATLDRWLRWIRGDFSPPADARVLFWARVPSALFGAVGAAAVFAIVVQLHSRLAGLLAGALVTLNPLYLTHARRAMSDSFAECLVALSVVAGLWGCKLTWAREARWWKWGAFIVVESIVCGMAALAKLNGGIATVIVLAMIGGTWLVSFMSPRREQAKVSSTGWPRAIAPAIAAAAVGCGSFAVFVGLNPLMTAHPVLAPDAPEKMRALAAMNLFARAKFQVDFRREWTVDALNNQNFKKDWLRTIPERIRMTVWEGFGRFSPLGPSDIRTHEPRPDREQFTDYRRATSLIWLPLVGCGLVLMGYNGWRAAQSGRPPLAWAVVLYMVLSLAIVVLMIPLNWDRYYLPLQAPAAVLVSIAVVATGELFTRMK